MKQKNRKYKKRIFLWCVEIAVIIAVTCFAFLYVKHRTPEKNTETEQTEKEASKQTKPADISKLSPGDVVAKEEIDFSHLSDYFVTTKINDVIFASMNGYSFLENGEITRDDLRYLKVLHYNFDHEIQVGELVVNKAIATDCENIFRELFENEYEIQSLYRIDRYYQKRGNTEEADREAADYNSINNNNSSAFHYRKVDDTDVLSAHAYGLALDINPMQNPRMVRNADGTYSNKYLNMQDYSDRSKQNPHMIKKDDICYRIFTEHGFLWGGEWDGILDYQHFEKVR